MGVTAGQALQAEAAGGSKSPEVAARLTDRRGAGEGQVGRGGDAPGSRFVL